MYTLVYQNNKHKYYKLVRPEEFESPTSRLRRPVFYPVELETHCLALEVNADVDIPNYWQGCMRPRLTQG
jgi:hypothetical protein